MKSPAVGFAIFASLIAIGATLYWSMKRRNGELGGFRDWVKNPSRKLATARYFEARDALRVPDDLSEAEIQRMVDRLFVEQDDDFNFERLKLVGAKAVPLLCHALEDRGRATKRFGEGGHVMDPKTPFERICRLLQPVGPAAAVPAVVAYMDHEDPSVRRFAAMLLGNIGTSECITPMLKALSDDEDLVRSFAMTGIQQGIRARRAKHGFLERMFPALTILLDRDTASVNSIAQTLLLEIDQGRGLRVLLSPEYFSIRNVQVCKIIRALNDAGHRIPHNVLLPFLKAVKPLVSDSLHRRAYCDALIAYAHHPDVAAETVFREELNSPDSRIQAAAAKSLGTLVKVANARDVVFKVEGQRGFDGLSQSQKHYMAVAVYDGEVCNGGHSQYFVNSSGDHWREAIDGLRIIGAYVRADILHNATILFGPDGPSTDNDERHRQIAAFSAKNDQLLDELDRSYFANDEHIESLLALFAVEHRDDFMSGE